jgi:hypothetical protein
MITLDNKTNNETDSDSDGDTNEIVHISVEVQFWTILILEIPSIVCTVFLLYHLILDRRLRQQIHNHVVIILLILCLFVLVVDNSFYLDAWRIGYGNSISLSSNLCLLWWFFDIGFYGAISIFLVWASFERHLLVFYRRQFLSTERKIFYGHYLPLITLSMYTLGFYVTVIFLLPCVNTFDFNALSCGSSPCYLDISWLNTWDNLFNGVLCNLLEALFSISLLVRTVWMKFYYRRQLHWKRYGKMTLQLLSISTTSLCINLPLSSIILARNILPVRKDFAIQVESYLFYFSGYTIILLPFACLGCLPELWQKLNFFARCCQRAVNPMTIKTIPRQLGHVSAKHY